MTIEMKREAELKWKWKEEASEKEGGAESIDKRERERRIGCWSRILENVLWSIRVPPQWSWPRSIDLTLLFTLAQCIRRWKLVKSVDCQVLMSKTCPSASLMNGHLNEKLLWSATRRLESIRDSCTAIRWILSSHGLIKFDTVHPIFFFLFNVFSVCIGGEESPSFNIFSPLILTCWRPFFVFSFSIITCYLTYFICWVWYPLVCPHAPWKK